VGLSVFSVYVEDFFKTHLATRNVVNFYNVVVVVTHDRWIGSRVG
jgi:hypothetical protein